MENFEEKFKSIDSEGSGKIEYTEFISASLDKKLNMKKQKLKEAFKILDEDSNEKISKKEIDATLMSGITSFEADKLFKKNDLDENEKNLF